MRTTFLLLTFLTLSPALALPLRTSQANRPTAALPVNLPDPYDYRVGAALILEVYDYGKPVPFRYSVACVRDAILAALYPIQHAGRMEPQELKFTAGNVDLVFRPDVRTSWDDWQAVLVTGLSHLLGRQLATEFQFIVVREGLPDHLGRGWLMLNAEARAGLDTA
ncbi:MAG: hypothetical protein Q9207_000166 [Kuettlingeria erythrocarpa]